MSLTFALRGQPKRILIDVLSDSSHNITYSILPEHSLETAESIVHIAAKTGGAICFEEGMQAGFISSSVALKERPKIALPIPSVWSMKSMIDELTVGRSFTFIPHLSTTVEEMQRLARMCQVGKCKLALDKRHTREQVIAVASSLPSGASLSLSTDQQDLRLQVAERMQPGCQLHLSHIESARELNDILSSAQDGVTVVLPRQMGKYVKQFQQRGIAPYTLSTSSDGSFCIAKTLCALAELAEKWALPIGFEPRVLRREENVLALSSLDP